MSALAIDRQGIQKIGGGELFGTKVDSVIPAAIPGYVAPDLGLKAAGDPDAAKKLLEGKTVPPLHTSQSKTRSSIPVRRRSTKSRPTSRPLA
jgi:hypothetical protein